jgi:hypothetical protein
MKKDSNIAEEYVKIIIEDDLNRITWEETLTQKDHYIERTYEIDDGAVIKYEWRGFPSDNPKESFNHKFTLIKLPKQNPNKLEAGVVKIIYHPTNSR